MSLTGSRLTFDLGHSRGSLCRCVGEERQVCVGGEAGAVDQVTGVPVGAAVEVVGAAHCLEGGREGGRKKYQNQIRSNGSSCASINYF